MPLSLRPILDVLPASPFIVRVLIESAARESTAGGKEFRNKHLRGA